MSLTLINGNDIETMAASHCEISAYEAMLIAESHIQSVLTLEDDGVIDSWKWGVTLGLPIALYDMESSVSAYYIPVYDEKECEAGYIIIGAQDCYAPIIEYTTSGIFFPYSMLNKKQADKIIYNGGLDYYLDTGNGLLDVSEFGSIDEIDRKSIICNFPENEKLSEEWEVWKEILSQTTASSNPPSSGNNYITNPDNYESGYVNKVSANVSGYNKVYKTTSSFSGYSNHCAPTAATNIMLYWYKKNSLTYGSLRKNGDSTWNDTFVEYHRLMGTTSTNGTLNNKLKSAYITYLSNAGFSPTVTYYSSASWNNIKTEIDANYPFHLVVQGHYKYGDHSLVGLGYMQYRYETYNTLYSRYIRVADGFVSSSSRFIHTTIGSTMIRMVKVRPN